MIFFAWALLAISIAGFGITFPLWLMDTLSERAMLGITLALSWAALLYSAALFIFEAKRTKREKDT